MENPWQPIETAPRDGSQLLLASIDDMDDSKEFVWGVRQGFYEPGIADRRWYDIDGGEIEPQFWMPLPPRPPRLQR